MRNVFKGTIRQLTADISDWQRRIVETQALIDQLSARAGVDDWRYSGTGTGTAVHVPPKVEGKRRRRRKRKAPKQIARTRYAAADKATTVAAPEPTPTVAKVRGATLFAAQLEELEKLKVTIDAAGDADVIRTLGARANAHTRRAARTSEIAGMVHEDRPHEMEAGRYGRGEAQEGRRCGRAIEAEAQDHSSTHSTGSRRQRLAHR